jgi:hypothetical protein
VFVDFADNLERAQAIAESELRQAASGLRDPTRRHASAYVTKGDGSDWALRLWLDDGTLRSTEISGQDIPPEIRRIDDMGSAAD